MKRGNGILIAFLVTSFFVIPNQVEAQKTFLLEQENKPGRKTYNLNGCELYIIIGGETLFVPKIAPFEFRTDKRIDSLLSENDTLKSIHILVRNDRNDFIIPFQNNFSRMQNSFSVAVFMDKKGQFYVVDLLETDGYGLSSYIMEVKSNKLWKEKYYKPVKKQ
jgi:hypothetical protein